MIIDNLKILLQLFYRPHGAMSEAIDKGSWLFGVLMVLIIGSVFQFTINSKLHEAYSVPQFSRPTQGRYMYSRIEGYDREAYEAEYATAYQEYQNALKNRQQLPVIGDFGLKFFSFDGGFLTYVMQISFFYVPATMLLLSFLTPIGRFGILLRRDYGTLLTCTFLAWAAAHLPFAIAGILLNSQSTDPQIYFGMWLASNLFFGFLILFALRTVFGVSFAAAIATISLSWLSMTLAMYIFRYISPWLFSPFLIFYGYAYLRDEFNVMGYSFKQRQNFRRFLNNATLNPHDADAQVQLGVIYKQRRQTEEALKHFQKAIEIDKTEIDANYELGKLARERGDFQEAINRFSIVVEQNDKHSLSEVWREIGATYLAANMLTEAREALEKFVERRAFDPEGLYYLGQTLKAQGEPERAREMFNRCIEAVQTSPDYRRYEQKKWAGLAKKAFN